MSTTFEISCKLGEGSFGCVYKAVHKPTNRVVALKQLPIDVKQLEETIEEVAMLQQCNCASIVTYYGSYIIDSDLWIVMEYCEGGSVSGAMKTLQRSLNEREIGAVLKDILKALHYLHSQKTIHRDVKAANVLLKKEGRAKLADLGVCCQLSGIAKTKTLVGSPYWMAPEVVASNGYDCAADIWSLGIIILEMAEGKPPYSKIHPLKVLFMIPTRPAPFFRQPNGWSEELVDFVGLCLVKDPQKRATAEQLLNHAVATNDIQTDVIQKLVAEVLGRRNNRAAAEDERFAIDFRSPFCKQHLGFLKDLKLGQLQELLNDLESEMEKEIKELKERYEAKVTPVRDAIAKKTET